MRIGMGYDAHKLVSDRKLILGGVEIPYERGLLGHSDADVLIHAIMDGMLGASGLGDIGRHFPDSDETYKGISSLLLLRKAADLIRDKGYCIGNIDGTIVAQRPKLAAYIPAMAENIASILEIDVSRINVKATTTEGMGFTGQGQGIAAYGIVLLEEIK